MIQFPTLLLASKSPRRHQILKEAGFAFEYVDIEADEQFPDYLRSYEVCEYLAAHKANHFKGPFDGKILVTADTIVCLDEEVINKPADADDAARMLRKLSGRMHEVFTGVCIRTADKNHVFHQRSEVHFHQLSDREIAYYIEHFHPFDKAGAYGVQDWMGYLGVEKINGCFYNVMGFPASRFYRELHAFMME